MSYLVLARHGESQFNAKSLWTGIWDVPLTKRGRHEASLMATAMRDVKKPAMAYSSALSRSKDTLEIILRENHWTGMEVFSDPALNERDYGDLTGMNKWAVEEQFGEKQFDRWRRGWDDPPPDGETLKHVYRRVVPYYDQHILPELKRGHNVLVVAHGNSLRALIKYLDNLTDIQVEHLEMPFGEVIEYAIAKNGTVAGKVVHKLEILAPPA